MRTQREIEAKSEAYNGSTRAGAFGKPRLTVRGHHPGKRPVPLARAGGMETKRIRRPKRLSHASAREGRAARAGNAPPEHGQARRPNAKPAPSGKGGAGCQGRQVLRYRSGRITERTERNAFGRDGPGEAIETRRPFGSATLDDRNREAGAARQRPSKGHRGGKLILRDRTRPGDRPQGGLPPDGQPTARLAAGGYPPGGLPFGDGQREASAER